MPKVFLSLLLFAGLLLLPGCSNAEAEACKAAQQSQLIYENKSRNLYAASNALDVDEWNLNPTETERLMSEKKRELYSQSVENYKLSLQTIVTYKECFSPSQVVEAQTKLEASK